MKQILFCIYRKLRLTLKPKSNTVKKLTQEKCGEKLFRIGESVF